jgi:hypothetical protein
VQASRVEAGGDAQESTVAQEQFEARPSRRLVVLDVHRDKSDGLGWRTSIDLLIAQGDGAAPGVERCWSQVVLLTEGPHRQAAVPPAEQELTPALVLAGITGFACGHRLYLRDMGKGKPCPERTRLRKNGVHHTFTDEQAKVLPKSPIAEAIGYALNQWVALERYLEVGWLNIDNNAAERALRPLAVGRKNWLFFGSDVGGQTAAVLYSLVQTCKGLGVEPWAYLRDVLERLPALPAERLEELLPDRWAAAQRRQVEAAKAAGAAPAAPSG